MPADGGIRARYDAALPSEYHPTPSGNTSADTEVYTAGERLRSWARHLAENSSIAQAILNARCAAGIGAGLTYQPMVRARPKKPGERGEPIPEINDAIRRIVVDDWGKSPDVTGELSRGEVERVAWRAWDLDGEVFGRRVFRGRTDRRPGLQIQLIESDLVPYGIVAGAGSASTMGIDRDEWGAPVRYWVYPYRPDRYGVAYRDPVPIQVQAADVRHLRRQERPGQTRGVTLLHAVILRISDLAEYMQSHRLAARASADLYLAVQKHPDVVAQPSTEEDQEGGEVDTDKKWLLERLQVMELGIGETASFLSPAHPNTNATEFIFTEQRQIAAGTRCAFSWISQFHDRAFTASRMENELAWRLVEQDRAQFIADFARPLLYEDPLRVAIAEGRLPARAMRRADPATLMDCVIDGPPKPSPDPVKDRQGWEIDQERGWNSRQAITRLQGRDPIQVDAERDADSFESAPKPEPRQMPEQDQDDDDAKV